MDIDRMASMVDLVGEAATLEQLAEELTEAAHAALKLARILRGDNPTPVTEEQARESLREEFSDVYQVARMELHLRPDFEQMARKRVRLCERLENREQSASQ